MQKNILIKVCKKIYNELKSYIEKYKINFVRCQDTNFLTINKKVLKELEEIFLKKPSMLSFISKLGQKLMKQQQNYLNI